MPFYAAVQFTRGIEGYISVLPCWSFGLRPRADKTRNTFICRQGGEGGREGQNINLNVGLQHPTQHYTTQHYRILYNTTLHNTIQHNTQKNLRTKSAVLWKAFSQSSSLASKYVGVCCTSYVPTSGAVVEAWKDDIWRSQMKMEKIKGDKGNMIEVILKKFNLV